jgi:hypothetical protein
LSADDFHHLSLERTERTFSGILSFRYVAAFLESDRAGFTEQSHWGTLAPRRLHSST